MNKFHIVQVLTPSLRHTPDFLLASNGSIKLADFGLARVLDPLSPLPDMTHQVATRWYHLTLIESIYMHTYIRTSIFHSKYWKHEPPQGTGPPSCCSHPAATVSPAICGVCPRCWPSCSPCGRSSPGRTTSTRCIACSKSWVLPRRKIGRSSSQLAREYMMQYLYVMLKWHAQYHIIRVCK